MYQERDLRLERSALERALPDSQHLRHDVLQVLGEGKLHPFRAHGGDVRAGRRLLSGERRHIGRRPRRGLTLGVVRHRRLEGTPQWGVWFAQTPETWPGNPRM